MYLNIALSPTEFKDIQSFLRHRHKKKAEERDRRAQRKIANYFTLIKRECNYDGNDEMNARSPTVPCPTFNSEENIAISTTFHSTQEAREQKKEVSRNLSSTIKEPSTNSKMQKELLEIIIQPAQTTDIRISDADNDPGVLVNEETQTDVFKQNVEYLEVQTLTYKLEETGVQTEEIMKNLEETGVQIEETTKSITSSFSQTEESTQNITSSYMQTEDESMNLVSSYMQTSPIDQYLEDKEIQTEEIKKCKELKMDIVQQHQEVQTVKSCINEKDTETMTDVDNGNILTVNKIEIVDEMETWGTQTDTL